SGAGRPSKRYRPSEKVVGLDRPARRDDLLVTLLGRALALVPPAEAEAMAEQLGEEYGRSLAAHMSPNEGQRSFRAALHAVADAGRVPTEGGMARAAIEDAREKVAALLGARPREVVFTSGATEAANAAIYGALHSGGGDHVVCPAVEHSCVREPSARGDVTFT